MTVIDAPETVEVSLKYGPWGERLGRPVARNEKVKLPARTDAERGLIRSWVDGLECELVGPPPPWWSKVSLPAERIRLRHIHPTESWRFANGRISTVGDEWSEPCGTKAEKMNIASAHEQGIVRVLDEHVPQWAGEQRVLFVVRETPTPSRADLQRGQVNAGHVFR